MLMLKRHNPTSAEGDDPCTPDVNLPHPETGFDAVCFPAPQPGEPRVRLRRPTRLSRVRTGGCR